ncbi:MAG: SLC13 family permease [Dehalococcoidales bacterium]|jgi:arsenical pump membrane protein|nr:SLC13 family permease [Dehalococcoidales bacterium]
MLLSLIIFIPAITLVMIRPRPLNEATAAALGAALMIIAGVISPLQTWEVLKGSANILLFFLGLMLISIVAEKAGFFAWCAVKAVKAARGRGTLLLAIVFGLGTLITAFFSNDATALILTPIVFNLVSRLKLNAVPYVFACAFIANTASVLLPVSNPVNLLAVEQFHITLGDYLKYLFIPALLTISVNAGLFFLIFRRYIYSISEETIQNEPVKVDRFFLSISAGLGIIAFGYILVSIYGLPLSYPAVGGAILLLACGFGFRRLKVSTVTSGISWYLFLFIFALTLLIKGLENAGVTRTLADGLSELASHGTLAALGSLTIGTALGSNLVNNWSMMMISVSSLNGLAASSTMDKIFVYGTIIGADIGPNLTILGSLSSMLWLLLLRQRGLEIRPLDYLKLGIVVTPPILIVGVLSLYACGIIWG